MHGYPTFNSDPVSRGQLHQTDDSHYLLPKVVLHGKFIEDCLDENIALIQVHTYVLVNATVRTLLDFWVGCRI